MKPSSPNRQDMLYLFERLVKGPAEAGKDFVHKIPTPLALYVLELAKKAKWPKGPHTKSRLSTIYNEARVIYWARRRKRELEDKGLPPGKAKEQAAKEASKKDVRPQGLSEATIADRMQRRRSRR
jgi:hypothetical protein